MSSLKSIIGRSIVTSLYYVFRVFPINKRKVFVKNFDGQGYGDSPKYIVDYLLKNYTGYDVVWCIKDDYEFPTGIRVVKNNNYLEMLKCIYEQVTAKVWIDNARKLSFERKRKNQYYIQTWHGDIGIKKAQGDAIENMPIKEIEAAKQDSQMADLFVCGNEWMYQRYREAYWYYGEVAKCGLPRRDILYNMSEEGKRNIRKQLKITENIKLLLYVPTFRNENIFKDRFGSYASSFDWNLVLKSMQERFGGEWYGLIRLHPNAAKYSDKLTLPRNVINVTSFPDVDELYCISDCCISDYSSSLFEFAVTKKPGFIYAPDMKDYAEERGYYFTQDKLPFTIATDLEGLIEDVKNFKEHDYIERHRCFYQDTIGMYPEGHASEFLAKRIYEVCS